jgi:hypothetical protein
MAYTGHMVITEITGTQLRESRELLGFSQWKLATESGINRTALKMYELHGTEPVSFRSDVMRRLVRYLENRGIVFSDDGSVELVEHAQPTMKAQIAREAVAS